MAGPESALWPSRKVSGPRLPRFASSPPNDADYFGPGFPKLRRAAK